MAKGKPLTTPQCRAIKPLQVLLDRDGLRLTATAKGSRRWSLRFTSPETGQRRDYGLGAMTLGAARKKAEEIRDVVKHGVDPIEERIRVAARMRADTATLAAAQLRDDSTLKKLARAYHASVAGGMRNRKHRAQWLSSLEGHIFPTLGDKPIASITAADLLEVMEPLQDRVPETAKRIRERLAMVFSDAVLRGLCDNNPADLIRRKMRRKKGVQKHFRALPFTAVPGFVATLQKFDRANPPARLALEFLILTAARSGEVRGATWSEFDLTGNVWTVPGERMKGGSEHRVPLPPRALAILREARKSGDGRPTDLVFHGRGFGRSLTDLSSRELVRRPLSDMALTELLRRLPTGGKREDGKPETFADLGTVHGFRSAFSTWSREQTRSRIDVIEAALAHREADRVAAAYSRAQYWKERVALALAWSQFVGRPAGADVIKFLRSSSG